jgi:hypothetical protein
MLKRSARVAACCLVALAVPTAPANAQLTPHVTCTTYVQDRNLLVASYGYVNGTGAPVDAPIGADNLFFPGAQNRGQPTTLLPGSHPDVFRTSFAVNASMPSITWFLAGGAATADRSEDQTPCSMTWAGAWQAGQPYFLHDVVTHAGASWVATNDPGTDEPGAGAAWQPLATGTPGPRGPAGPAGPAGRQGEPGPAGDRLTFPSSQTRRFPRSGRRRIEDAHVMPSSVILVQYVGRAGRRPTAVAQVQAGSFVAKGSPGRRFDYVVFNAGA